MFCVFMAFLICCVLVGSVYGASNKTENMYFSIELPSGYSIFRETMDDNNDDYIAMYKIVCDSKLWSEFNAYIMVYDNTTKLRNDQFNSFHLDELESKFKKIYKDAGINNANMINRTISNFTRKSYRCLLFSFYVKDREMYQKDYITCSDNYTYELTITTNSKADIDSELLFKEFVINDTISTSTSKNKNWNLDPGISLFVSFVLTIIFYLGIAFVIRFGFRKRFNKKTSFRVAFWLTALGYLAFILLYGVLGIERNPSGSVAFLYFWISRGLLHDKELDVEKVAEIDTDKENKTDDEDKVVADKKSE